VSKATDISVNIGLRKLELEYAKETRKYFELAKENIYIWCDFLGYELREREFYSQQSTGIFIRTPKKKYIGINSKLPYKQKIVAIAHEMFHDKFHPECVAFRVMGDLLTNINEGKAELFATLILYPTLESFDSEDDFILNCGLQDKSGLIRLNYFRKTGT
jgi:Zn-dependent peptidase ImmA (M78 family)